MKIKKGFVTVLFAASMIISSPILGADISVVQELRAEESSFFPETVTNIEAGVFANCSSLKEVTIPDGVERFKKQSFILRKKWQFLLRSNLYLQQKYEKAESYRIGQQRWQNQ